MFIIHQSISLQEVIQLFSIRLKFKNIEELSEQNIAFSLALKC
jgi:hypothetical protein